MWNCLISCFVEEVNTRERFCFSFPELWYRPLEFNSTKNCQHLMNRTRWDKHKKIWSSTNSVFKWCFCSSHHRCFLRSLIVMCSCSHQLLITTVCFCCRFKCSPDHYTHASVIAQTLSLYLSLLDESCIKKLSACVKSDCSHWLSKLFGWGCFKFGFLIWHFYLVVCLMDHHVVPCHFLTGSVH